MSKDGLFISSGTILFCTSAVLFTILLQRKHEKKEPKIESNTIFPGEEDINQEMETSLQPHLSHRFSYGNMVELYPSSSAASLVNITTDTRQNTISQVNDCHVTTTTNNWNHFQRDHEREDAGYQIRTSLSQEIQISDQFMNGCDEINNNIVEVPLNDTRCSEWDVTMNSCEDYSSFSDSDYSSSMDPYLSNDSLAKSNKAKMLRKHPKSKIDRFAQIMPRKLILVRHGQSEGNVSEQIYATKPDNSLNLTELGWEQARMAGKAIKDSIVGENESIHFVVSPYVRTVETFHGMLAAWVDPSEFQHIQDKRNRQMAWYKKCYDIGITWSEDPRIREQDFGNYQDPAAIQKAKRERHKFGTFYYRFPHGESASDVFDRVSTFLDSLWRSFDAKKSKNYVIVTHGIAIRVFLARYFRYTIDQFNVLSNPKNGEAVVLKHDGLGKLKLDGRSELFMEDVSDEDSKETKTVLRGYSFHKKLRVLPVKWRKRREVKLSYLD